MGIASLMIDILKLLRQNHPVFGGKCVLQVNKCEGNLCRWLRQCLWSSTGNVFLGYNNGSDNAYGLRREKCFSGPRMAQTMLLVITRRLLAVRNFYSRNGSWFLMIDLNMRRNLPFSCNDRKYYFGCYVKKILRNILEYVQH